MPDAAIIEERRGPLSYGPEVQVHGVTAGDAGLALVAVTVNVCCALGVTAKSSGDVQGMTAVPSRSQAMSSGTPPESHTKWAVASGAGSAGPLVMEIVGGAGSTVHPNVVDVTVGVVGLAFVACTRKVWAVPAAVVAAETVRASDVEAAQGPNDPPSRLHVTVAGPPVAVDQVKFAAVAVVLPGPERLVTAGGGGSTVQVRVAVTFGVAGFVFVARTAKVCGAPLAAVERPP
jgi:hypothetical protein